MYEEKGVEVFLYARLMVSKTEKPFLYSFLQAYNIALSQKHTSVK